jgi:hypothetical protein
MPKIEVNQVAEILKKHKLDPSLLREIVEEMNVASQPDPGEEDKPPPLKKQFVILVSDPQHKMPKADLVGWVAQIPADTSPATLRERIFKGAYDFNASKKGSRMPVKSVGEALEAVGAKYFKDAELWVKTKEPVAVLVTDNVLPRDEVKIERVARKGADDAEE